ncbi:hypothetical protein RHGRI_031117 [Rhododendron griersonianum]|uniref:Uncharacterized protein n=1 Tax=Rhododendron griersonianum TaxID=479676 RepID=A0AAV6IAF8_9ERIC|nr:hypothetical protein RHGRI_031117 [Rhododendron griersonianum]
MGQSPLARPARGVLNGYVPFKAIARARLPFGISHGISSVRITAIIEIIRSPETFINTGLDPCSHPSSYKTGPLFAPILLQD